MYFDNNTILPTNRSVMSFVKSVHGKQTRDFGANCNQDIYFRTEQ